MGKSSKGLSSLTTIQVGTYCGTPVIRRISGTEKTWLIRQLADRKARIRSMAACDLGKLRIEDAIGPLIGVLRADPHWLVRVHAAWALGLIGDKSAIFQLTQAYTDICPKVRQQVILSLGNIHDDSAIPFLLSLLSEEGEIKPTIRYSLARFMKYSTIDKFTKFVHKRKKTWCPAVFSHVLGFLTPILIFSLNYLNVWFSLPLLFLLGIIGDERAFEILDWYTIHGNQDMSRQAMKSYSDIECRRFEKYLPPESSFRK